MKHFTNFRWLLLSLLLAVGTGSAWGQTTDTYIFTSKSWGATLNGSTSNWTSGNDGGQLTSGQGIQVTTTYSGANGTSPISYTNVSRVVVTYCTNNKAGAGSIAVTIGNNSATSQTVTKPSSGGTTLKTFEYNYSTPQSGYVNVAVTCTANSIYIYSVAITYNNGNTAASTTTTIDASGITNTNLANGTAAGSLSASVTSGGSAVSGATVTWSSSNTDVAEINSSGVVTLVGAGTTTITASYAGVTDEYEASSATYSLTVTNFTPTDGTFDFTGTYDYGSGLTPSSNSSTYIEESKTWTSGNVTLVTDGKYRWWAASGGNSLRVYAPSSGSTTLTLSVPSGKVIKGISITGSNLGGITADVGTYSNGTWTGSAQTVVFTRESANTYFSTITVTYEDGSVTPQPVNPTFEWSSATATATVGEAFTAPTLTNTSDGTVSYASSDTSVATIDANGVVTIVGAGTTTISASVTATSNYNAATASYTLTVSAAASTNELVTVDSNGNVTFLFNDTGWGLPEGSSNKVVTATQYTNSGYTITVAGSSGNGFYYNTTGYLLMGKSGAYLTLPTFTFDVERIEVTGTNTASGSVGQNIYVGETAVSTETTGAQGVTNTYVIADAYQAAGNQYTLKVTSAHNTQFTQIKVYKKSNNPSISFTNNKVTVYVGETATQTANSYNIGENTISYATGDYNIAIVNASTGEVTGVTAGTTTITATVTVDGTAYTASYTVEVKKNDAGISYDQTSFQIEEGSTFTAPTLNNPNNLTVTYASDNTAIATVDSATGAVTLAGATGLVTITATFEGNDAYNAGTAFYTIRVRSEETGGSGDYEKITSITDLTDGDYLIVYEDGSLAFDGGLSTLDAVGNSISVTITNDKVESNATVDAAIFTITAIDGGYSIQSASGKYIGNASNSNSLTASETSLTNTISFNGDGTVNIVGSGGAYLRYNKTSGQTRFRYFKSSTYAGQEPVALYKRTASAVAVKTPIISPETGTYSTRPQTVTITCATEGATIYYTLDGTNPTNSSTQYTGSFTINSNKTIKAIAYLDNEASNVAEETISFTVNPPVFSETNGSTFNSAYDIEITADPDLTIYFITQDDKIYKSATGMTATKSEASVDANGNPILVSTVQSYSGALTFSQSIMITAVAVDDAGVQSDPVTVQYTHTGVVSTPYFSEFSASAGDFTITGVASGSEAAPEWKMGSNTGASAIANWGEERYYMMVKGTSGNTNETRTRYYGTAYLTSPTIDLTDKTDASFSFIHAGHHFYADPNTSSTGTDSSKEMTLSDAKAKAACRVQIGISDASGNVTTWTDISDDVNYFTQKFNTNKVTTQAGSNDQVVSSTSVTSRSGNFPRANSGDISLASYAGNYIRIRFAYTSTSENYGTWNIDQVTVNASATETITLNSRGWTTYVLDHDIDAYATTQNYISGGEETLKIYKVTEFDNDQVVLQQLGKFENPTDADNSERYLHSQTPVVIEGPAGDPINFVVYNPASELPLVKNNLLYASLSPNLVTATEDTRYYVLQWDKSKNEPMFNRLKTGREVPDHKAYLNGVDEIEQVSTKTNSAKGIRVLGGEDEGEATDIDSLTEEVAPMSKESVIFDLSGRRVMNPTKGLYFVNGKKVYLK